MSLRDPSLHFFPLQRNPLSAKTKTDYTMAVVGRGYGFFLRQIRTRSEYSFSETDAKEGAIFSFVT